jgi:hypothetical protein
MTTSLEMHQRHDRYEMAHVKTRRGRIEADVPRRDATLQQSSDSLGMLIQQTAPSKLVEQCVRHRLHDRPKIDA